MVKRVVQSNNLNIGKRCNTCDKTFENETDFKDHILTTVHRGPPSEGTRNFQYRLTAKKAKSNLLKGAQRDHFSIEHKQGTTNVDFSGGSWLLTAVPQLKK